MRKWDKETSSYLSTLLRQEGEVVPVR